MTIDLLQFTHMLHTGHCSLDNVQHWKSEHQGSWCFEPYKTHHPRCHILDTAGTLLHQYV